MNTAEPQLSVVSDADPFDILYYLRVFWRRRWVVLGTLATVLVAVGIYTARQPKVYSASANVIIDVTAPRVLDNQVPEVMDNSSSSYWYNREYYETQHKVIVSRSVSSRVVEKLGLQSDPAFLGLTRISDPQQRAEAMKNVDAIGLLQSKIRVLPVKDSRLVQILVEDLDPARAALLANEVADAYMAENLALKLRVTESASRWLEDRLVDLEQRAKQSELAVYDFKKEKDMLTTSLEDRASMVSARLNTYNGALSEIRTRIAELKARADSMERLRREAAGGEDDVSWVQGLSMAHNTIIDTLKLRYVSQRSECAELAERYLPEHPRLAACTEKLRAAHADLSRELSNLVRAAETDLAQAQAQERNLLALFEGAKAEAFEVNKKQIEFDRLKRESDNDRRLYDLVLKRLKDIELSGLLRTSNVRVLDAARPSFAPIRPVLSRSLTLAALVGLLLGLGLALLLDLMDNSIFSQTDVEQRIGVPFLGMVPVIPEHKEMVRRDLYIHEHPKSSVAECCRAIRTNLLFMSPEKSFKTLLVTSTSPQEGKSTSVINFGVAMAQSGNRVLLLDTDMRRPRLHKVFQVPNDVGISSLVVGQGKLEDAIKSTEIPGLFVMPCGPVPPNPAELLHTKAFAELLATVSGQFDRVILDSPPIHPVADAVVLSTQVDGVVLVFKAGLTSRTLAKRAVRALRDVKARVYGAILNSIDLDDPKYGGYYTEYRRYGYYYGERQDSAAS